MFTLREKKWLISISCCKVIAQSIIDKIYPQSYFMYMYTHSGGVCVTEQTTFQKELFSPNKC